MCGIFCLLSRSSAHLECNETIYEHLKRRGPNSSQDLTVSGTNSCYHCLFSAHVLHMRGLLTPQPVQDNDGNILLWNGEIFGGLSVLQEDNDTAVVSQKLSSCCSPSEILTVLSAIRGPWGFVYYQKAGDYLWFGRDFFGRRSLLWKFDDKIGALTLTSVAAQISAADQSHWKEIPAVGVYRVDLKTFAEPGSVSFEIFPWTDAGNDVVFPCVENILESIPSGCNVVMNQEGIAPISPVFPLNMSIPKSINKAETHSDTHLSANDLEGLLVCREKTDEVNHLIKVLSEAVRRRVQSLPLQTLENLPNGNTNGHASIAVLFSGGIDSMILAALADRHIPAHQPIDLLNVAFQIQAPKKQKEYSKKLKKHKKQPADSKTDHACSQTFSSFDVPDRLTGKAGLKELQNLHPERQWIFVEINVTQEELQKIRQDRICHLVHPLDTVLDDSIGCAVWFAARGRGVITEGSDQRCFTSSAKVKYKHQVLHSALKENNFVNSV